MPDTATRARRHLDPRLDAQAVAFGSGQAGQES
jgi:hypothetical protein